MSVPNSLQPLSLRQFADRFRGEMIPLASRFSYFCAAATLSPEELKDYLDEPVAALPPAVRAALPSVQILLVPYLERILDAPGTRKQKPQPEILVSAEKPNDDRASETAVLVTPEDAVIAFAVKEAEVADYHYRFYRVIAELIARRPEGIPSNYRELVDAELAQEANGEVDEESWVLKESLTAADRKPARRTARFKAYLSQSFVDTLTLYLHGVCCDIDVEPGPRQLPSHLLRKRLRLFREIFPPPEGYAVLPEDLKNLPALVEPPRRATLLED